MTRTRKERRRARMRTANVSQATARPDEMSSVWCGSVQYVRRCRQPIFGHYTHDKRTVGPARHDRTMYTHTSARIYTHTYYTYT